jgi:GNAT superfamily N-acetyltransferase
MTFLRFVQTWAPEMNGLSIRVSEGPCPDNIKAAGVASLRTETENAVGAIEVEGKSLFLLACMENRIVGGVSAKVFYNWLYIDLVWVEEEFRGRGIGTDLMNGAEEQARQRALGGIYRWPNLGRPLFSTQSSASRSSWN